MRIYLPFYSKPKTDLGRTSGKNPSDRFVRLAQELPKSVAETNSKYESSKPMMR